MKQSRSSAGWRASHEADEYVKRARREGYRSRASFKLLEIDDKYHLLKRAGKVLDLGSSPGGWSQVAARRVGHSGRVIALDVLPMQPIAGVDFIQGDFTEAAVLTQLTRRLEQLQTGQLDLVISDMAPNMSGMKAIDQPRAINLAELAVALAEQRLKPDGDLLFKCFEGEGIDAMRRQIRRMFTRLHSVKPRASRPHSREVYLLGRGFRAGVI